MKKLLILPLIFLLSACVSYYYPETALEDGVYYAEDDPSYVVYQGGYHGAAYYPWSSLDYFYFGYHAYYGYAFYYGHPYGVEYIYSPWHYPNGYYGYYSPWYASFYHYPFYPTWRPYRGHCSYYHDCKIVKKRLPREDDLIRYAGTDSEVRRNRDDDVIDGEEYFRSSPALPIENGRYSTSPFSQYVSTAPAGYSSNRGMVIRRNESTKIGKSRLEPVTSSPVTGSHQVNIQPVSSTSSRSSTVATPRTSTSNSKSSRSSRSPTARSARVIRSPRPKDDN